MPVSGGQLALVMAKVTTTNHCGQNTGISFFLSQCLPLARVLYTIVPRLFIDFLLVLNNNSLKTGCC